MHKLIKQKNVSKYVKMLKENLFTTTTKISYLKNSIKIFHLHFLGSNLEDLKLS